MDCTSKLFPVDIKAQKCDVAASIKYSKILDYLIGFTYAALILSIVHFLELIFKIKSMEKRSKSESSVLSRFVHISWFKLNNNNFIIIL